MHLFNYTGYKIIVNLIFLFMFISCPLLADDCLEFKQKPKVVLSKPEYNVEINQPNESMDLSHHGHVIASMSQKTGIETEMIFIKTGFCVVLKNIDIEFGYNNFLVEIDKSYKENTCPFNAVMAHEQKHIDTYLSVINDFKSDLENTFFTAADSVMPVFIEKKSDFDNAIEVINQQIKNHPYLILMIQKIKAEEEIRNKKIDQIENGVDLIKCFD